MAREALQHVIVDGSNIATEGRDAPSLQQLDEAVQAFIREYEPEIVTVVVDATFPNRIARGERKAYEDALSAGEIITPPAGAIGRGDGFILQIADRAEATVLSNDSFQEFHGQYQWLFEPGRLIGGKPVPHVGWVFMDRAPVRGPASRRAVSAARRADSRPKRGSATAAAPTPAEPTEPLEPVDAVEAIEPVEPPEPRRLKAVEVTPATPHTLNEALPFIEFVGKHPVGSGVEAVVERFGSHGAYVRSGDVRAYVPLNNLGTPAPRSPKEVLRLEETRQFVVAAIDASRRGVDLALPPPGKPAKKPERAAKTKKTATEQAAAPKPKAKAKAKAKRAKPAESAKQPKEARPKKSATKKAAKKPSGR